MLVYDATKKDFVNSVYHDTITDEIYEKYFVHFGKSPDNQIASWQNSMQFMYKVLNDETIPDDAGIAIEFNIPTTAKRIDFIISGFTPDNKESVIIIELKQWQKCKKVVGKEDIVRTFVGRREREVAHPSYQAWSYASLLENFNTSIEENHISLYPCAYLHNYDILKYPDVIDPIYDDILDKAPLYSKGDIDELKEFIKKYVKYGDNKEILYKIEAGKIKPSQRLQDVLASMLKGNKHFLMIDEQKVAYEYAVDIARKSYIDDKKRVLIVEGGPGTGKSVIAINLLVDLINDDMNTRYVTRNSTPRMVFKKELRGDMKVKDIDNLFMGSMKFNNANENDFEVLVVDEAHRLNEKNLYNMNTGNQIKNIINAAKTSIFLIDDKQKVTIYDIGNVDLIKEFAKEFNAECEHIKLKSQFRCNGSNGYLLWLDDLLQIENTANFDGFDYEFDFRVMDTAVELQNLIFQKDNENHKSRIVAGYCWDWLKDERENTFYPDIVIGDFAMSWNLSNTDTWAIDEKSVNEVGSIHTCQGLEFDYVGVIIGKDLKYRNGKVVTDFNERSKDDKTLWGIKKMSKENPQKAYQIADEVIKNTYRTLMTRGMKGCYVYCVDEELQKYFKERLNKINYQ